MDTLAFPFRFSGGRAARLDDQSEEFAAQFIATAIQTRIGELPISYDFGCIEAEFNTFDTANFLLTVSNYAPGIRITDINKVITTNEKVQISVKFNLY